MNPDHRRSAIQRLASLGVFSAVLLGVLALTTSLSTAEDASGEPAARPDAAPAELSQAIDRLIDLRLEEDGIKAAPRAGDAEFLRRVYLDLVGTVPTIEEVQTFTTDRAADKRERTIEALLSSEAFSEYWGGVWFKATTGLSPAARRGRGGGQGARYIRGKAGETYLAWLKAQIAAERPYDEIVHDMVMATGRTDENGAAGFLARWSENVNNLASATSKVFLGTRIQCAQCHDHIYEEDWKQKDFQGMAAFFATTRFDRAPEYREFRQLQRQMTEADQRRRDAASAGDSAPAPDIARDEGDGMGGDGMGGDGMEAPSAGNGGKNRTPGAGKRPAYPGLEDMTPAERRKALAKLRGSASVLVISEKPIDKRQADRMKRGFERRKKADSQQAERLRERLALMTTTPKFWMEAEAADIPGIPRRLLLARWMTSPDNQQFKRTLVNRYWGHFLGYGFVHPVDDFTSFNEPSYGDVLDLLANDFGTHGYDLKRVIRVIVNTEAYQRTSRWTGDEEPDPQLFAKAPVRPLTTEQLYHALIRATGMDRRLDRRSRRDAQRVQAAIFSAFSFVFDDDEAKEEQDFEGSIPQGLFLMNGDLMQKAIGAGRGSLIDRVMRDEKRHHSRVGTLYLAAYGREPSAQESNGAVQFVESQGGSAQAYEDLWWALLNSAEFMTNH